MNPTRYLVVDFRHMTAYEAIREIMIMCGADSVRQAVDELDGGSAGAFPIVIDDRLGDGEFELRRNNEQAIAVHAQDV